MMMNLNKEMTNVIVPSLATYLLASVLVAAAIFRFKIGDLELLIPGALVLLSTTSMWLFLIARFSFCRRKLAVAIFLLLGILAVVAASIIYPILRMGALWEEPGDLGGAWLGIIMGISFMSQSAGFIAGFIPAAVFIRRLIRRQENMRIGIRFSEFGDGGKK